MLAQAPPNLTPVEEGAGAGSEVEASWAALLGAGINDWAASRRSPATS